ncbi:hypothetical protein [Microbacterium sp.]|uniref:hypothetical protein n=1 Tax=Microbacterium sp. TaxID=51671 RepID=UPI0039E4CD65
MIGDEVPRTYEELEARVAAKLRDPRSLHYFISCVRAGTPLSPTSITLIRHRGGRFTATRGDDRDSVEPVLDDAGEPMVFPDEAAACAWAWEKLKNVGNRFPKLTPEQEARGAASGAAQRARAEKILGVKFTRD